MESGHIAARDRIAAVPFEASPLTSARILALATRAVEGAPALTAGEVRELASAVLTNHSGNASDQTPPAF